MSESSKRTGLRIGLFPIIGWTEFAFELFQGIAKRLPIHYEMVRAGVSQMVLDHPSVKTIETIQPSLPFRRQACRD